MSRLPLAVAVLSIFLLLLLFTAPATLLDAELHDLTQGKIRLVDAQGSVWSGNGQLEIRDAGGAAVMNRALSWELDKSRLLLARLSGRFQVYPQPQSSTLSLDFSSLAISDIDLSLPATALALLLPAAKGYGVGGTLSLHGDTLIFRRTDTEGKIRLRWQDASSVLAPIAPLGSYELWLEGVPAPGLFNLSLQTLDGPLQLNGSGSFGINRPPGFTVSAQLPPAEYDSLAPFLRLIAVEATDGSFMLQR
ncbi:MAG: type II secretion system protein N [Pseudohongiellaceae bacterium]